MNMSNLPTLLAQTEAEAAGIAIMILGFLGAMLIPFLLLLAFGLFVQWKIYLKAGQPGWACLIPVYSTIIGLQVQRRPVWWLVFFYISWLPIDLEIIRTVSFVAGLIMWIFMGLDYAKHFGKGMGFALGLIFPFTALILYPILAFGSSQYQGVSTAATLATSPPAPPADPPAAPPADPPADHPAEEA